MSVYNLIEYSDKYLKKSASLWQYYGDKPTSTDAEAIDFFPGNCVLFKTRHNIVGKTEINGTKNVNVMVPSKYVAELLKYH